MLIRLLRKYTINTHTDMHVNNNERQNDEWYFENDVSSIGTNLVQMFWLLPHMMSC